VDSITFNGKTKSALVRFAAAHLRTPKRGKSMTTPDLRISPFEGMAVTPLHILLWGTPCILAAILTSGVISIILWVLFALLVLPFLLQLPNRVAKPWRRVHYPLMYRYAQARGFEAGKAQKEGRSPDTRRAVLLLLRSVFPKKSENDLQSALATMEGKMGSHEDIRRIASLLSGNSAPLERRNEIEEQITKFIATSQGRDTLVLYVIAEIVERKYGVEERARYLLAAFQGRAT
jgi:hypothetical protein